MAFPYEGFAERVATRAATPAKSAWRPSVFEALVRGVRRGLFIIINIGFAAAVAGDAVPPAYEPARFFNTQILPILERHCFECHSEAEEQDDGGLVLDSRGGWVRGGDHGPAVVAQNLQKSPLIRSIRSTDPGTRMPPDDPLSPLEIALLQTWVMLGAPDPRP